MIGSSADPARLVQHLPFVLFWASRVLSSLAFQMVAVVLGWLVYEKTGSAYDLGLLGLFQFLPMVCLTFLVGYTADRFDRRRIVFLCQLVEGATLAFLTLGAWNGWLGVPAMFAAAVVLGGARSFEQPSAAALLPGIVPSSLLHQAIAAASSATQTATIIGPSLGGVLYVAGASLPLGLSALFFVGGSIAMASVRADRSVRPSTVVTFRTVFSGVSFIRTRPILLGTISLDLFAVLLGGVVALLPVFARDVLHAGPWGLGLLRSAPAVGALAMSVVLTRMRFQRNVGLTMFGAVIVYGVATVVFSASTNLLLSLIALFVLGAADNVSVVIRTSLVQLLTPAEMRGRVNAVNSLFIGTSNQLGEFESGMTAGLLGAVPAGILGGIGTVIVALLWMRFFPALRRIATLSG